MIFCRKRPENISPHALSDNFLFLTLSLVTITIMKNARGTVDACEEPRKDLKSDAYGAQRTDCCGRNG